MKKLIVLLFSVSLCMAGISTTTNIMPAQVCTTDTFTFTFPINSTSDLKVITIRTSSYDVNTLTLSTDYTVSATNNDYSAGGTVTTASTYGSGYKLIIYRDTELTQTTTLISDSGVLRTRQLVSALDKQMMISQDLQEEAGRSLKFPVEVNSVSAEIPSQTERASKYLAFNSSGQPVATSVLTTGTASFSTFGTDLVACANAGAAQTLLGGLILSGGSVPYAGNQPMAGYKITGYGTPADENDVVDVNYVKDSTITLKNKTLTSPVINTGVSGTAVVNDGNLAGNSSSKLVTEHAAKYYADLVSASGSITDYSSTSTIVGWTSYTSKKIYYLKINKLVFVSFNIAGTSNATGTTFTLPVALSSTTVTYNPFCYLAIDNTSTKAIGYGTISGSTITFYPSAAGGSWTNSGTKLIQGSFTYLTD